MSLGLMDSQWDVIAMTVDKGGTYRVLDLAGLVTDGILGSTGTGAYRCTVILCHLCDMY